MLDEFEKKFNSLITYFHRYNKLDDNSIERILSTVAQDKNSKLSDGVLVHGISGRLIKAQSVNQRKMVDLIKDNDMLFAIGPAGTGKTYTAVALAVRALKEREVRGLF